MADQIKWRGLTLVRGDGGEYLLRIAGTLEVSALAIVDLPGYQRWRAVVGLGRCDQPRETYAEALDQALRDHQGNAEKHAEQARHLEAFSDFLGLDSEADNFCANCGHKLTSQEKRNHPGKCYACAEGR